MSDPRQFDAERIRVVLDHGEVVELDGGTLVLDGQESPSVVLRLTPWRARSVARVLQEWSAVSRIFHHSTRPHLDELELSRTLQLAAAVFGDGGEEPIVRSLAARGLFPPGNDLLPWQSWANGSRICPQRNALLWWMRPRGGFRSRMAARNLPTHYLPGAARLRSPPNTCTSP